MLKGVTKTIKNETKEKKGVFLGMSLGTLGASLLGNMLAGKGMVRTGYWKKMGFLMPPQIQNYYQNEYRLNSIFSRDNLPNKIKDGTWRC